MFFSGLLFFLSFFPLVGGKGLFVAALSRGGQGTNAYLYVTLSTKSLVLGKGDVLVYRVFLPPWERSGKGGLDATCAGGADLRDSGARDQNGLSAHGDADLSRFALGKWYERRIPLDRLEGKKILRWDLQFEADPPGIHAQVLGGAWVEHPGGRRTEIFDPEKGIPPLRVAARNAYSPYFLARLVAGAALARKGVLEKLREEASRFARLGGRAAGFQEILDTLRRFAEVDGKTRFLSLLGGVKPLPDPAVFKGTPGEFLALVKEREKELAPLVPWIRSYRVHLVGHAHIDLQWLWCWDETIGVVRKTFGGALRHMREDPDFTFTQSSPALYLACEEHFPRLFGEIQKRVAEGRWEIAGGRWCEGDENIISSESHARHFLYGQRYFLERFGKASVVGWEPDTFGHPATTPAIQRAGGQRFFYFCRGGKGRPLFRWKAPGGKKILAFDQQALGGWYLGPVRLKDFRESLGMREKTGSRASLWVYGVGDHGGGPTDRDLRTARFMMERPELPEVRFSTARAFFEEVEKNLDPRKTPVLEGELNPVFPGCYTSHADVKWMNRAVERELARAEAAAAAAALAGAAYPGRTFRDAWRDVLWAHHHDTLGGTGIHASYERVRMLFHRNLATLREVEERALGFLAGRVKRKKEGKGVPVLVFNPLCFRRTAPVEIPDDRRFPEGELAALAAAGERVPVQRTPEGTFLFVVPGLPSLGYQVYRIVRAGGPGTVPRRGVSVSKEGDLLWGGDLEVVLDRQGGGIERLGWKGRERVPPGKKAFSLEMLLEGPGGSNAWNYGKVVGSRPFEPARPLEVLEKGPVRVRVAWESVSGPTRVRREVLLYRGLPWVELRVRVDWNERPAKNEPRAWLRAFFPLETGPDPEYLSSIPFGEVERPLDGREMPALRWVDLSGGRGGAALFNDSRHGHGVTAGGIHLSLMRATTYPDFDPNPGRHWVRLALFPHGKGSPGERGVPRSAQSFEVPPLVRVLDGGSGEGEVPGRGASLLPPSFSFVSTRDEGVEVTGVKKGEEGGFLVRFFDLLGKARPVRFRFAFPLESFRETDFVERPVPGRLREVDRRTLEVQVGPFSIHSLLVRFPGKSR